MPAESELPKAVGNGSAAGSDPPSGSGGVSPETVQQRGASSGHQDAGPHGAPCGNKAALKKQGIFLRIFEEQESATRWCNLYQLAIIISGLFTTATFPGMFSPYVDGTNEALGAIAPQGQFWWMRDWFRAACVMSFSSSLVCIMSSFFVIIVPYSVDTSEWVDQPNLVKVFASRVKHASYIALIGFLTELLFGLFAAALCALAFLYKAAGCIAAAWVLVVLLASVYIYWGYVDIISTITHQNILPKWCLASTAGRTVTQL